MCERCELGQADQIEVTPDMIAAVAAVLRDYHPQPDDGLTKEIAAELCRAALSHAQ
jgi:hypothetical protein